jgi:hypothetical protein
MSSKIIYDNSDEFLNRAGTLDFEDYIGFELRPDWRDALFLADSLPCLKEFVARNPGYHIVSCSPYMMVNKLVEACASIGLHGVEIQTRTSCSSGLMTTGSGSRSERPAVAQARSDGRTRSRPAFISSMSVRFEA